jgi:hypothetical protein
MKQVGSRLWERLEVVASKAFGRGYLMVLSIGILGLDRVSMGCVDGRCDIMVESGMRDKGGDGSGEASESEFEEEEIRFSVFENGLRPGCIGGTVGWLREMGFGCKLRLV